MNATPAASHPMLTINRIGRHLGAEISGVDLAQPLDGDTFAKVSKAFFDNEVVVFRKQKLTPEQQIAFTRRFGVLEQHVRKEHWLDGYPEILIVSNVLDGGGKAIGFEDAGRFWHSDLSYKQVPSLLSALYAIEVPVKNGAVLGNTSFASTTAAYDALLKEICAHVIKPEFQYEHHWQAGDLLMWDNCSVQHRANFNYRLPLRRLMYRTTVRGTAPF